MMKYEITKEQILEVSEWTNYKDLQKIKQWFPDAFKPVLEVGKWYKVNVEVGNILFNFQGKESLFGNSGAFGFTAKGEWHENLGVDYKENNVPATKEEVFEMLKKEAGNRGFKEWVFIKRDFDNLQNTCINTNTFPDDNLFFFSLKEDYLEMNGFVIYSKGKWAEIIQTMTKSEAEAKLNCKIV